jgi:hypothetical protein
VDGCARKFVVSDRGIELLSGEMISVRTFTGIAERFVEKFEPCAAVSGLLKTEYSAHSIGFGNGEAP